MGLSDIVISKTTIEYREQEISVRGISVTDLMHVANLHGPQIALIFGKMQNGEMTGDLKDQIANVARELPELTAAVIACAADDFSNKGVEVAGKLPFNTQVELIEAIFNETFHSEADIKKLMASLTRMIAATSGALTEVMPHVSINGIGASEDKPAYS